MKALKEIYVFVCLVLSVFFLKESTAYGSQFTATVTGTASETVTTTQVSFDNSHFIVCDPSRPDSCQSGFQIFLDDAAFPALKYNVSLTVQGGSGRAGTITIREHDSSQNTNTIIASLSCTVPDSSLSCKIQKDITFRGGPSITNTYELKAATLGQDDPFLVSVFADYTFTKTQTMTISGRPCTIVESVTASESPKDLGTCAVNFISQPGGTISDKSFSVSSNNPNVRVVFSDTKTSNTRLESAHLIATDISHPVCGDTETLIQALVTPGVEVIDLNPQNQGNCTYTLTTAFDSANQAGLPSVSSVLTINGNGAIIERSDGAGTPDFRIFDVRGGILTLRDLIVRNGRAAQGGCIYNKGGKITISHLTVSECSATTEGGAIHNDLNPTFGSPFPGSIGIERSSVVNNRAPHGGGAISNYGAMGIVNSTIAQNDTNAIVNGAEAPFQPDFYGKTGITNSTLARNKAIGIGGVGEFTLQNTILAENTGGNCEVSQNFLLYFSDSVNLNAEATDTCTKQLISDVPAIFSATAGLASLIDPGTPGDARFPLQLQPNSPAIDAGSNTACPTTDQLDHPRPVDGKGFQTNGVATCDIGAIEFYPKINLAVDFEPDRSTFHTEKNTDGCPSGFQGTFNFTATLKGQAQDVPPITDLFVQVVTLTNDNLLMGDGGPGGVGTIMTILEQDQYSDGTLEKTEFVDVPFTICLKAIKRFDFVVDVYGKVGRAE